MSKTGFIQSNHFSKLFIEEDFQLVQMTATTIGIRDKTGSTYKILATNGIITSGDLTISGNGVFNMGSGITAIPNGTTTPVVTLNSKYLTANLGVTTITDFLLGQTGQVIIIVFGDNNTTVQHGANIQLSGGANKTFAADQALMLMKIGGGGPTWVQIGGEI